MKEKFEKRMFRIFKEAGFPPAKILTITPEEMVEIPHITVPNIRTVLNIQNEIINDKNLTKSGRLLKELIEESENE